MSISLPSEGLFQRRFQDEEEIIDVVKKEFPILKQTLISRFKALRAHVYKDILPRHTIKIKHLENKAIYLLPLTQAKPLFDKIEELKKGYSDLQMEIDEYLKVGSDSDDPEGWLDKVERYTSRKKIRGVEPCPNLPERVYVHLTPIELRPGIFEEFVEDHNLRNEMDETVGIILRNDYEDTVKKVVQNLEQRLGKVIARLSRAVRMKNIQTNNLALAREVLDEIEDIAKSANLDSIFDTSFKHANLLIEAMEDGEITDDFKKSTVNLVTALGFKEPEGELNPRQILADIALDMQESTSPRVKALLKEMI